MELPAQLLLKPDGRFAGFRGPTDAEVAQFWSDAGIPNIELGARYVPTTANYQPVADLQALWGDTGSLPSDPTALDTWVTTGESYDPIDDSVEGSGLLRRYDADGTAAAQMRVLLGQKPDTARPSFAHALVRAVPEPTSLLLSLAATGAALRRPPHRPRRP